MPAMPTLGKLRQEDGYEFKASLRDISKLMASLNYVARPGSKK